MSAWARRGREAAQALLAEHGVERPPVSVEKIARQRGITVEYAPFEAELSGLAHIRDGVPLIGINATHASTRQRFTLAHELGHILLHRAELERAVHVDKGSLRRDALAAAGVDRKEIEANAFAAELLMPQAMLAAALGGRTLDLEDDAAIERLAKMFRVSTAAIRFRFDVA